MCIPKTSPSKKITRRDSPPFKWKIPLKKISMGGIPLQNLSLNLCPDSCTHTRRRVASLENIWSPIPAPGPAFKQPSQQTQGVGRMLG